MSGEGRVVPEVGSQAPVFAAMSHEGKLVSLSDFCGKNVVLYFYPKDDTPGCTIEAQEFRDAMADLAVANAVVLGVSPDDAESHCGFIEKFDLNFTLLVDSDNAVEYGLVDQVLEHQPKEEEEEEEE